MFDMKTILQDLAANRPVFEDKRDFQQALAGAVQEHLDTASVQIRFAIYANGQPDHKVDIWVAHSGRSLAAEVHYRTDALVAEHAHRAFTLRAQKAQDYGRYDFLKDVERLEKITSCIPDLEGWVILLTNDHLYWEEKKKQYSIDQQFHVHEGRRLSGELRWGPTAGKGSTRRREEPIVLEYEYCAKWENYSHVNDQRSGTFRYLALRVPPQH